MNPEHERELWQIRFQRVLDLEIEAVEFYQRLLREKAEILKETGIDSILKEILRDEGRHVRIAKDLLRLTGGTNPASHFQGLPVK